VRGEAEDLHRVVEVVLSIGLAVSGLLLLVGLLVGRPDVLRWGILLLLLTPVARVVVVTVGLFHERDFIFGLVSLWILGVLVSGMLVAVRL
jgi:uncharacterized membrane protein